MAESIAVAILREKANILLQAIQEQGLDMDLGGIAIVIVDDRGVNGAAATVCNVNETLLHLAMVNAAGELSGGK